MQLAYVILTLVHHSDSCPNSEWLNGMAHGRGVETFADGTIRHEGLWRQDEPVPNANGKMMV
jgi:MORN repeat